MTILLPVLIILFALPSVSFAWGFETHLSIGLNILQNTSVDIIRNNQAHFLCGNIFPDLFNFLKDFSSLKKNLPTHSWATVSKLFANCEDDKQRAFCYGYSSHLSADIVAHNHMVPQQLTYVNAGRMRSHLILEMAEESMHDHRYNRILMKMLKHSPDYGDVFLSTMGIGHDWFSREVYAIRLAVISQKHLKMHQITRLIKNFVEPNFADRCDYFREAAMKNAQDAVEQGFAQFADTDPSGQGNMQKARALRRELLKDASKRELKDEFKNNIDQKFFPLDNPDA